MPEINKQFGFYGTIKNYFDTKATKQIWNLMISKMTEMYPKKTEDEILEFLNARTGRHFAGELLDIPDPENMGMVMMKIALLNKLKMAKWWAYHNDIPIAMSMVDKRILLKTAIKSELRKKDIRKLAEDVIGCGIDKVWSTPEMWLDAESTTTEELQIMWGYIQEKITKGTKYGNNSNTGK